MAPHRVDVRSIQALNDLQKHLVLFQGEAEAAVREMEAAIQQALRFLYERERYWQRKVDLARQEYKRAQAALAACRSQTYTDPKTGRTYRPPCTAEQAWVERAGKQLAEVTRVWHEVVARRRRVELAAEEMRRRVRRLAAWTRQDLPKAQAQLERQARALHEYAALSTPGSPSSVTSAPSAIRQTSSPLQVAQGGLAVGLTLTAIGAGAIGLSLLRWLGGSLRGALGQAGEALAADLLRRDLGLQEMAFDPPKHGFDRVFRTEDGRVIILESKVHGQGRFRPGQTQTMGEQGSPEWIAAHAERMADPSSKEWSPANERIAALIREIGAEQVAVVGVVIQTTTGKADVYIRHPDTASWEPLQEGVSLEEVLGAISDHDMQEIPLDQIDWEEMGELTSEAYRKVSAEEMQDGLRKLMEVVRPAVQQGATAEDFDRMDEEQGLDYAHGYRRIYDAFYGPNDCVVVEKVGDRYRVVNGRHRLWLAREMGMASLPARLLRRPGTNP